MLRSSRDARSPVRRVRTLRGLEPPSGKLLRKAREGYVIEAHATRVPAPAPSLAPPLGVAAGQTETWPQEGEGSKKSTCPKRASLLGLT